LAKRVLASPACLSLQVSRGGPFFKDEVGCAASGVAFDALFLMLMFEIGTSNRAGPTSWTRTFRMSLVFHATLAAGRRAAVRHRVGPSSSCVRPRGGTLADVRAVRAAALRAKIPGGGRYFGIVRLSDPRARRESRKQLPGPARVLKVMEPSAPSQPGIASSAQPHQRLNRRRPSVFDESSGTIKLIGPRSGCPATPFLRGKTSGPTGSKAVCRTGGAGRPARRR